MLAIFPCMFNSSDSWGCSIADGLKVTSRCNRLLGMQEFQLSNESTITKLSNCFTDCFYLHNILNEYVHATLCLEV